jgi:hypothetical protein
MPAKQAHAEQEQLARISQHQQVLVSMEENVRAPTRGQHSPKMVPLVA